MESCINTALYFIAAIAVFVPLFGFGIAPGSIVSTALTTFLGNTTALLKDEKILDGYLEKNKNSGISKMITAIFSKM